MALQWTHDLPQEEGWYLMRIRKIGVEDCYYVTRGKNGRFYRGASRGSKGCLLRRMDSSFEKEVEWAGPLPEPAEADEA